MEQQLVRTRLERGLARLKLEREPRRLELEKRKLEQGKLERIKQQLAWRRKQWKQQLARWIGKQFRRPARGQSNERGACSIRQFQSRRQRGAGKQRKQHIRSRTAHSELQFDRRPDAVPKHESNRFARIDYRFKGVCAESVGAQSIGPAVVFCRAIAAIHVRRSGEFPRFRLGDGIARIVFIALSWICPTFIRTTIGRIRQ